MHGDGSLERGTHIGRDDSAETYGEAFLQHDDALRAGERPLHGGERPGPEAGDAQSADARAAAAHLVYRVLDRSEHGAERHDDGVGAFRAVRAHQAAGLAPEGVTELVGPSGDQLERLHLLRVREIAHFGKGLRADHRANGDRLARIEDLPW